MSHVIAYDLQFECILRMDQGSYKKGGNCGQSALDSSLE